MYATEEERKAAIAKSHRAGSKKDREKFKAMKQESAEIASRIPAEGFNGSDDAIIEQDGLMGLKPEVVNGIRRAMEAYCDNFNIDTLADASGTQWRGACLAAGDWVKRSGILYKWKRSDERFYSYDMRVVELLLHLWEGLCQGFRHAPLKLDFAAFAGLSMSYMSGTSGGKKINDPRRDDLIEKLNMIQEAGISAQLTDGKTNPVGTIFFAKAKMGWRETTEVIHTEAKQISSEEIASRLPEF